MHVLPESVFILVLNWNGLEDTLECLTSLHDVEYINCRIVAIDNGSRDGSVEKIRKYFPAVEIIENEQNMGYAGGNNVGIQYALDNGAEYIFILNNDTIVDKGIVTELVAASKIHKDCGIFGAKIYYYAEPEMIWYGGTEWDADRLTFVHDAHFATENITKTAYACGCAFFIPSKIVRQIGMMDPLFFLTYEEVDWCYRARKSGIESYLVPTAKVWHKISASFGGNNSPLMQYFYTRNTLLWAERYLAFDDYVKILWKILKNITDVERELPFKFWQIGRIAHMLSALTKHLLGYNSKAYVRPCFLGLWDYALRRFGPCSQEVTVLNRRMKS